MIETLLEKVKAGDFSDWQGSALKMELPVAQDFVNRQLEALTEERLSGLSVVLENDNLFYLEVEAKVPVVGKVRRRIRSRLEGQLDFEGGREVLYVHILGGLKIIDKPILNLFREKIARALPEGASLDDKTLAVNIRQFMAATGQGHFLQVLRRLNISTTAQKLWIKAEVAV